jgi:hypothetical protein
MQFFPNEEHDEIVHSKNKEEDIHSNALRGIKIKIPVLQISGARTLTFSGWQMLTPEHP